MNSDTKILIGIGLIGALVWWSKEPAAEDRHALGLRPPTDEELFLMGEKIPALRWPIGLTALGLGRINQDRISKGIAPLPPGNYMLFEDGSVEESGTYSISF